MPKRSTDTVQLWSGLFSVVQFLRLTGVLVFSVLFAPEANPRGVVAGVAAMIAVSAMACQFTLLRLGVPGAPSTAVMTGNLTRTVLSLLDTESRTGPLMQNARKQLNDTLKIVVGFFGALRAPLPSHGLESGPDHFRLRWPQ